MPHYYAVMSVKASGTAHQDAGQTASRTLENFGFEPGPGKNRQNMHENAVPKLLNIVVRCDTEGIPFFKLVRVEKRGQQALLTELDAAKILVGPDNYSDRMNVVKGNGRRLTELEVVFEKKQFNEHALTTHGDLTYDNHHRGEPRVPNGKRIRTSVVNVASRFVAPSAPVVTLPAKKELPVLAEKTEKVTPTPPPPPAPQEPQVRNGEAPLVIARTPVAAPAPALTEEVRIPAVKNAETREYVACVAMADIIPDPDQPRDYFDEVELHAMAESMKEESQVVLVIVRPIQTPDGMKYKIIDGERRWRSAKLAGITELLVVIRPNTDDRKAFRQSVIANYNRKGHTVSESVNVIRRLLADGATAKEAWTLCGMSPAWYYNHTSLMKLELSLLKLIDPPTEKRSRLPLIIAKKLAYLPLAGQLPAYHKIMCEPSKTGRAVVADELARPYMAENTHNKPSDHARTVERFVLRLRGSKRSFEHVDAASRALVLNRKPEQVELILSTLKESVHELVRLLTAIETERQKVNPR